MKKTSTLLMILGWVIFGLHFLLDRDNPFYGFLNGIACGMFISSLILSIRNKGQE